MSYNRVILLGNLTRDPELKFTPAGKAVCQLGLALNHKWKTDGGEMKEEVTFVDLTAWGRTAETIGQHFRKGEPIHIEGRLKLDEWNDKQSGQKRSKLSVVVESFSFTGAKKEAAPQRVTSTVERPAQGTSQSTEPDDIPF